jgi:hypothetical protein
LVPFPWYDTVTTPFSLQFNAVSKLFPVVMSLWLHDE